MAAVFPGQLWGGGSGGDTGNLAGISDLFGLVQGRLLIGKRKYCLLLNSVRSASPNDVGFYTVFSLGVVRTFFFFFFL